jgi:hypothetical protein
MDQVFVARAKQLRNARELIEHDSAFASATALLAVHSGIALNDALLTIWCGTPTKGENHSDAVRVTKSECRTRKLDDRGVRHLESLIRSKSAISYGDEVVTYEKAAALAETAKRFESWIFSICKELARWEQQQSALRA